MIDAVTKEKTLIILDYIIRHIEGAGERAKSVRVEFGDLLERLNAAPEQPK